MIRHTTSLGYSDVILRALALYEILRRMGFAPDDISFEVGKNAHLAERDCAHVFSPFLIVRAQDLQYAINLDAQEGLDEADGQTLIDEMGGAISVYNAGAYPFDSLDRMNAVIHATLLDMGGAMTLIRSLMDKGFEIPMVSSEYLATGRERSKLS
jgi:hypothetical protein